jgi:hypothetical protein
MAELLAQQKSAGLRDSLRETITVVRVALYGVRLVSPVRSVFSALAPRPRLLLYRRDSLSTSSERLRLHSLGRMSSFASCRLSYRREASCPKAFHPTAGSQHRDRHPNHRRVAPVVRRREPVLVEHRRFAPVVRREPALGVHRRVVSTHHLPVVHFLACHPVL